MTSSHTASDDTSFILVDETQERAQQQPKVIPHKETFAHDWSPAGTGGKLYIHGRHVVDAYGRVCNLRGVNLSGNCKTCVFSLVLLGAALDCRRGGS